MLFCFSASQAFADSTVEFGGLVEVEANAMNDYEENFSSNAALATVELGVNAVLKNNVSSEIVVLYENETPLDIDVASITIDNIASLPLSFTAGQFYIPFGQYDSAMISDPLTLEIGENRANALQANFDFNQLTGAAYLFKSDTRAGDNIRSFGVTLNYAYKETNLGVNYISNIMGTHLLEKVSGSSEISDPIGGVAVYANTVISGISVGAEFLTAVDSVSDADLNNPGDDVKPSAYSLEIGSDVSSGHHMALGIQGSMKSQAFELPKTRLLAAYAVEINESTSLGFEVAHDIDYSSDDGGTGKTQNIATVQLATSF